jgi:GNAT superfamily N-acetyltransferase
VLAHEYPKYRVHLKALDEDSKILRFGYHITDEVIDKLCDGIEKDSTHHILFCIENSKLEFIAVGHIAVQDGMELAFSVHKEFQHQGMGDKLMQRCIQYCRTHGILKGCMICLSHNKVIQHLCRKHGIHIHTEYGETQAELELDNPNLTTYINEQVASNMAVFDYFSKRTKVPWAII